MRKTRGCTAVVGPSNREARCDRIEHGGPDMSTSTTRVAAAPIVGRGRDPFIDLLRVGAILIVVLGHWIMPVFDWRHGTLSVGNSLSAPGWWVFTWLGQVMPVFFFAGGAANYHSYGAELRRGSSARTWLVARLRRLIVPAVPMVAVWLVAPSLLRGFGLPAQSVALAAGVVGQLLWFLAVYLLTIAAAPAMHAAARRWGLVVPVVLGLGAFGVDALRFHGVPLVGYVNELLVWLAIAQLGIGYAAGQLDRLSRRGAVALGCTSVGVTVLLVLFGPYPASMVGLPGQAVSNMSPATACLLTLGVGQIGILLALRNRLVQLAKRPLPTKVLRAVAPRCMTLYLWHMSAMMLVAGIAVLGFGYATPTPGDPAWLVATSLWVAALATTLYLLIRAFGRFEQLPLYGRTPSGRRLATAFGLTVAGLCGISLFGFADLARSLPSTAAVLIGLALTWQGVGTWLADRGTRLLGVLIDAIFTRYRR
jgi:hypothetical protein